MRGHDNQIAFFLLGSLDDGFIRRDAGDIGGFGRCANGIGDLGCGVQNVMLFLLCLDLLLLFGRKRERGTLGIEGPIIGRTNVQQQQVCFREFGEFGCFLDGFVRQF